MIKNDITEKLRHKTEIELLEMLVELKKEVAGKGDNEIIDEKIYEGVVYTLDVASLNNMIAMIEKELKERNPEKGTNHDR